MSSMLFSKSQYVGVHNVENEPERVMIEGVFSMNIPVGFSYIIDANSTAKDFAHGGINFIMQAQQGFNNDFALPYARNINVVIYGLHNNITVDNRDLMNDHMAAYIANANNSIAANGCVVKEIKYDRDCAVYACMYVAEATFCRCRFQIFVAGCSKTYLGEILVSGKTPDEYGLIIMNLLKSIDAETVFAASEADPVVIRPELEQDFDFDGRVLHLTVDKNITPVGYSREGIDELLNSVISEREALSLDSPWYTVCCGEDDAAVFQVRFDGEYVLSDGFFFTGEGTYSVRCTERTENGKPADYASVIAAARGMIEDSFRCFKRFLLPQLETPTENSEEFDWGAVPEEKKNNPVEDIEMDWGAAAVAAEVLAEEGKSVAAEVPAEAAEVAAAEVPVEETDAVVEEISVEEEADTAAVEEISVEEEAVTTAAEEISVEEEAVTAAEEVPAEETEDLAEEVTEACISEDISREQILDEDVLPEGLINEFEAILAEEPELEETIFLEESATEEEIISEEPSVGEESVPEEEVISEESAIEEESISKEPSIAEAAFEEEIVPEASGSESVSAVSPDREDGSVIGKLSEPTVGETVAQPSPEVFAYYASLEEKALQLDAIREFFGYGEAGYANEHFRADKSLLFLKKGEHAELLLYCNYGLPANCSYLTSGTSASGGWGGGWIGSSIKFNVAALEKGNTVFTFTNNLNDDAFSVLVICE